MRPGPVVGVCLLACTLVCGVTHASVPQTRGLKASEDRVAPLPKNDTEVTIEIIHTVGIAAFSRNPQDQLTPDLLEERLQVFVHGYEISNRPEALRRTLAALSRAKTDAWGTPLRVSIDNERRGGSVSSAGPDRKFGTTDDISCAWVGYKGWDASYEEILWNYAEHWKVAASLRRLVAQREQPVWAYVQLWEGSSSRQTELFEVSSREWRIHWVHVGGGAFSVTLFNEAGRIIDLVTNIIGPGTDISYVHASPGRHYLKVDTTEGNWTLLVEHQVR